MQSYRWLRTALLVWLAVIPKLALAGPAAPVPAVLDSLADDSARYVVRIPRIAVPPINVVDTIDVTIESYGHPYAGCSFKFGANSPYIDIIAVLKGEIVDSCKWEYFRANRIETGTRPRYPRTLWSAVALAKFSPDTVRPACLGFAHEGSIVRLVVVSAPNVTIPDSTAAIFFFWEDCRDNTLSDSTGGILYVSRKILDCYDPELPQGNDAFPTRQGTPDQCINLRYANHPRRQLEFYNGGLRFELKAPPVADSVSRPTKTK